MRLLYLEALSKRALCFLEFWCGEREPRILILAHLLQLQLTLMSEALCLWSRRKGLLFPEAHKQHWPQSGTKVLEPSSSHLLDVGLHFLQ